MRRSVESEIFKVAAEPSPAPLRPSMAGEMSRSNVHIPPETLDLACGADRIVNHDLAEQ